jgi:hypothetical protein
MTRLCVNDFIQSPPLAFLPKMNHTLTADAYVSTQISENTPIKSIPTEVDNTFDIPASIVRSQSQTDHQDGLQELANASLPIEQPLVDEDVFVEESVVPFYMNSGSLSLDDQGAIINVAHLGENLHETLDRLGINLPAEQSLANVCVYPSQKIERDGTAVQFVVMYLN